MRLFHFSDDPSIDVFVPRPVRVPATRTVGMDWLNGPLVWAIDEEHAYMYLFPRDCPRILLWATGNTTPSDKAQRLGQSRVVAYIERHRLESLQSQSIHRYEFRAQHFECLHDAGMWVSREEVTPMHRDTITDLPAALRAMGVELRVVDSLVPLRDLWNTTLHVSGIRLRYARGWAT